MRETSFVTHSEYQKHIRGEWRTIHDLWPHIRHYMTSYAQPGGFTPGSIPFADATGFLVESNANLFWDAGNDRLGIGTSGPVVRTHIRGLACADYGGFNPDTILLLENNDNVALQFQCATDGEARICFADDDYNPPAGRILYDFSGDYMDFTVGKDVLVKFEKDGADSRITSNHKGIKIDSTTYAAFIADSHNADAYFALEEDGALKWTMGFDYDDGQKFQISQGIPGASVRFEIDGGTIINLYLDVGIRGSQDLRFYTNGNYVAFKPPALGGDTTWTLPAADGPANEVIGTDNAGNLIWRTHDELAGYEAGEHFTMLDEDNLVSDSDTQAATQQSIKAYVDALPAGSDEKVKIDIGAVAGYIGAAFNDGVIRTGTSLSYADGGNFITINTIQDIRVTDSPTFDDLTISNPINIYALSHDSFADYVAKEHRAWEDSIAQDIHDDNISESSVTQHVGAIDHDALLNTHANPYKLDDLAAPDDNTDLDFSTTKHGLVPKGTDVGNFLKDDGTWAPGGGGGDVTAAAAIVDHSVVRGDGGGKGIQDSGVIIDDTDNVTGMVTLTLPNEGLHLLDTGGDHDLIIKPGTDLGADRILTITTGDVARTITLSGNPTLGDWFDQAVKQASAPTLDDLTISNPVNIYALSHDSFADWAANKHVVLPNTIANVLSDHNVAAHNALDITELGTISSGVWQGTVIANVYIAGIDQNLLEVSSPTFDDLTISNPVNIYALSHNAFADYAVAQHRVWEDSIAQDIHADNISEGSVTQHVGAIDHDALLNTHANPYKLDDLAAPDDNTDLDFSTLLHGLVPKGVNLGKFLKDDGTWAVPAGGGDVTAGANLTDHAIIRGDGGAKGVQDTGILIDDSDRIIGPVTIAKAAGKSQIYIDTYDTTPTDYSQLYFRTSDSDVMGTLSETQHGDTLGRILFHGVDDNSSWQAGARITAIQNTASGTGEVPTDLILETYSATILNENQLVLKKGGNVSISKNFLLTSATSTITGGTNLLLEAGNQGVGSHTAYDDTTVNEANMTIFGAERYAFHRSTSALRYKDKVEDLELDLSLLHQLRPVSFNSLCTNDDKTKRFHGLIADEVAQVIPGMAIYNKDNEVESYDNRMLTTLLLAEVQNQRVEIDALKAQLNN